MAPSSRRDSSSRSKSLSGGKTKGPRPNDSRGPQPAREKSRPQPSDSRPQPVGPRGPRPQAADSRGSRPQPRREDRGVREANNNPFRHEERPERGTSAPLHRPVAIGAIDALASVMLDGRYADKVIERAFKTSGKMGARDRRAFAEIVYELVRWWRRFGYAAGFDTEKDVPSKEDLWKWLAAFLVEKSVKATGVPSLPPWEEFGISGGPARIGAFAHDLATRLSELDAQADRAVHESIPDWLDKLGERELKSKWSETLHALNQEAPVVIRANTLKCTREELAERLKTDDGINTAPARQTDNGLMLAERRNVFTSAAFKEGWFEVQDGASQQVAQMLGAKPGERVIDACAGAGGKTLAIGAMMKNKGRLISLDVNEIKLQELRRRVARSGIDTCEAKLIDSQKVIKRLENSADRVLLDVPCSGLGVLRRNPDKKWKFQPDELERLHALQAQILDDYSLMAKKGGTVVYATCSCLPSENRAQVDAFLKRRPEFKLSFDRNFLPDENRYDGFYAAVLTRT